MTSTLYGPWTDDVHAFIRDATDLPPEQVARDVGGRPAGWDDAYVSAYTAAGLLGRDRCLVAAANRAAQAVAAKPTRGLTPAQRDALRANAGHAASAATAIIVQDVLPDDELWILTCRWAELRQP